MGQKIMSSCIVTMLLLVAVYCSPGAEAVEPPSQADRVEVGQTAPAFTLSTLDGATVSLETSREDGPLVLIFFRGAW